MMRFLLGLLRILGYLLSALLCVTLVVGIPYGSWQLAQQKLSPDDRLRSFFRVRESVAAGRQLRDVDLEHRIDHIATDRQVLYISAMVERYARVDLKPGDLVTKQGVWQRPQVMPAGNAVIAQVGVGKVYATGIVVGMRVAFARQPAAAAAEGESAPAELSPETIGIPKCGSGDAGFEVVSVTTTEGESPEAIIGVRMDATKHEQISRLTVHEWVPILVSEHACM